MYVCVMSPSSQPGNLAGELRAACVGGDGRLSNATPRMHLFVRCGAVWAAPVLISRRLAYGLLVASHQHCGPRARTPTWLLACMHRLHHTHACMHGPKPGPRTQPFVQHAFSVRFACAHGGAMCGLALPRGVHRIASHHSPLGCPVLRDVVGCIAALQWR